MVAADLADVLRRRFPQADASLEADLAACEEAAWGETITPRDALKLIQKLHAHQEKPHRRRQTRRRFRKLEREQLQTSRKGLHERGNKPATD